MQASYPVEIKNLNNLVNLFLDIAENNAERSITMYMEDWKNAKIDIIISDERM